MNPYYELPKLSCGYSSAESGRVPRPGRQIDGLLSVVFLRLVNGLEPALRSLADSLTHWRRRRAAIRELRGLNAHQLADIGLERRQIVPMVEQMLQERSRAGDPQI